MDEPYGVSKQRQNGNALLLADIAQESLGVFASLTSDHGTHSLSIGTSSTHPSFTKSMSKRIVFMPNQQCLESYAAPSR
jgi:hypothetical protein